MISCVQCCCKRVKRKVETSAGVHNGASVKETDVDQLQGIISEYQIPDIQVYKPYIARVHTYYAWRNIYMC